jgi:hypothetical protein
VTSEAIFFIAYEYVPEASGFVLVTVPKAGGTFP